jgi:Uma2 family endonuclease
MTPAERDREEERILGVLDEYREAMSEGTRHSRPKINAYKDLGDHFSRVGRRVFLATELAVLYPAHPVVVPDLLAVMDAAEPERERESWRVVEEGRGIDLVLEFRNLGKKHKDLVDNVKDYAGLGVAEYFSLDCRSKMLRGWRLASPGARFYTQMVPQGGVFPSQVLDLELGIAQGRLRFFKNMAQIPTSEELLGRVQEMTDAYQHRLEEAERLLTGMVVKTDDPEIRARQNDILSGFLDALPERREELVEQGIEKGTLREARKNLRRVLKARGLALAVEDEARIDACDVLDTIERWLDQAVVATSAAEALR